MLASVRTFASRSAVKPTLARSLATSSEDAFGPAAGGNTIIQMLAKSYQKSLGKTLRAYGLKYDDIINEWNPDTQAAIERMSPEDQEARTRRLQRALDLSFKRKALSPELQQMQRPFQSEIRGHIEECEAERVEKEALLDKTPYNWDQPIIMGGTYGLSGLYILYILSTM